MKTYIVIFLQKNISKNREGVVQVLAHTFCEAEIKAYQLFTFEIEIVQITIYN